MLLLRLQWCLLMMWTERKKHELLMDVLCAFFLLSSQLNLTWVSVVFNFNDSLNDVAPVSPILLAVDVMRMKKEWIVDGCLLCFIFCLHHTDRVQWVLCLTSILHSMILLLFLQCCSLLMWWEWKRVNCWWMSFVCLLSFVFTTKIEFSECCVWLQYFTQWCYPCVSHAVACWLM